MQVSRYFSHTANRAESASLDEGVGRVRVDSGDVNAMRDLKRAIGHSPPRAAFASVSESGSNDDEDFFTPATSTGSKGKGKEKTDMSFGEPGSEDYPFDFELDDSFLEQISRVEHEAYLRQGEANGKPAVQPPSAPAPQQVKAEPRGQSMGRTLFNGASTAVGTRRSAASSRAASAAPMEVIDISDDKVEDDKENVPAPTRHVRRRVAPVAEDVIELSD